MIPGLGRSLGEGIGYQLQYSWASLVAQLVKNPPAMWETCLSPGLGRSPREGRGYPLQYFGLENSMDCIVYGVAKSRTPLSDFHLHFHHILALEQLCEVSKACTVIAPNLLIQGKQEISSLSTFNFLVLQLALEGKDHNSLNFLTLLIASQLQISL